MNEGREDITRFHDAIATTVEAGLKSTFLNSPLTRETCLRLYEFIFNTVGDVFTTAGMRLSNDFINYVAQEFYSAIEINGREQQLDRNIFTRRVQLGDVKTIELHMLAVLFRGTDGFFEIYQEIRKRS